MNKRQLDKMIRQIVAEERKKKSFNSKGNSRSKQLRTIMERASRQLAEISGVDDYYAATLKGNEQPDESNLFAGAFGGKLKDYNQNKEVWDSLYADTAPEQTVGTPKPKASECLPSQANIGAANSLGNLYFGNGYSGDGFDISADAASLIGGEVSFADPILLANCSEGFIIVDGHHRWSQIMMLSADCTLGNTKSLNFPGMSADDVLQAVHVAIAELSKNAKSGEPYSVVKEFKGANLLTETAADLIKEFGKAIVGGSLQRKVHNLSGGAPNPNLRKWYMQFFDDQGNELPSDELNITYDAKQLYDDGVTLPFAIAGKDCTATQYDDHFIAAINAMQDQGTAQNAPDRNAMPQADDTKKMGFSDYDSTAVYDHIAQGKMTLPSTMGEIPEGGDDSNNEAKWHKGEALNESQARWQKLAGILKD